MTGPGVVTDKLDAQGVLQPGQTGYWKVWGATAADITAGDLLMVKWGDDIHEYEVAEVTFEPAWLPQVVSTTGERFRVGGLQPVVLLRQGTHHTLSPHCR